MTINNSKSTMVGAQRLIWLLFALTACCMISGYKGIANYIAFGSMLMAVVLWVISNNWRIGITKELIFVVWFMLYYILTSIINLDVGYFVTYTSYNLLIFFPVLMCLMLEKSRNIGFMRACAKVALVFWFAMAAYTAVFYLLNPQAARLAASHQSFDEATIIGGYHLAYGSSLLAVYLFSLLFDNRITSRKTKFWLVVGIAVLALVIYLTESTLTTFSLILGVAMVLIFDRGRDSKKSTGRRVVLVAVLVGAVLMLYYVVAANARKIAAWLDSRSETLFFYRIGELIDATFLDQETGHYNKRVSLIEMSWNSFLSSPIFGIGYKYGNVFQAGRLGGIGSHSEIMDLLARYGIVGATPVFALYYLAFKRNKGSHVGVLSAFALMMTCNPFMSFQSHLVLFVLIPMMERMIPKADAVEMETPSRQYIRIVR